MTGLLATFLGSSDEPNPRGELDGAAWRFVLPRAFDTVEWRCHGTAHQRDLDTLARHATVLRTIEPASRAIDDVPDRLVVGPERETDTAACAPVGIDLDGGDTGQRLELRFVGEELRGVAPLDDARARAVLARRVGDDGPVPRSLKQRVKGSPRRVRRTEIGTLRGTAPGPPAWLVGAAAEAGVDIARHGWALWSRGDFGSQKLIMFLIAPGETNSAAVVKIVRDPRFNDRLANESEMLRFMERFDAGVRGGAPSLLFHTTAWGSAVSAQTAVDGTDLRSELVRRPELMGEVTTWMIELASATRTPVDPAELRECLDELLARYIAAYDVPATTASFLRDQAELLAETELHAVAQHGDAGPWNAVVTDGGRIAFLDWEAGERRGMPLWDLLYFLRSSSLIVSQRYPWQSRRSRLRRHLLAGSTSGDRVAEAVRTYVQATELDPRAVEPLYHLCWVHRAVKEARRLVPDRRSLGVFHRFVLDGVAARDQPGLRGITLRTDDEGVRHGRL
ncbi:MAG TPA: phosphotransferase [Ilumatobacter sp.]|nr:phosphotransferase [Ilumatobacter sp.]